MSVKNRFILYSSRLRCLEPKNSITHRFAQNRTSRSHLCTVLDVTKSTAVFFSVVIPKQSTIMGSESAPTENRFDLTRLMREFMEINATNQTTSVGKKDFLTKWGGCNVIYPMALALPDMDKFQGLPDDIAVVGVAKSGASRFCALVGCLRHADDPGWIYKGPDLQEKVPWIDFATAVNDKGPRGLEQVAELKPPRTFWSRMSYDGLPESVRKSAKIVYHLRHPKDTLVTLYHHYAARQKFTKYEGGIENLLEMCITDEITCGPWFQHYLSYWRHRNDPNVYVCSFEEFSLKPEESIRTLAGFLEISITEEQLKRIAFDCHFEQMRTNEHTNHDKNASVGEFNFAVAKFMRCGQIRGWTAHLTPEQNERFNAWMRKNLNDPEVAEMAKQFPVTFAVEDV